MARQRGRGIGVAARRVAREQADRAGRLEILVQRGNGLGRHAARGAGEGHLRELPREAPVAVELERVVVERAAMVQVLAMQTGRPLLNIDDTLAQRTLNQIVDGVSEQAILHFESLKRMLDREEPGWRKLSA